MRGSECSEQGEILRCVVTIQTCPFFLDDGLEGLDY